MKVIAPGDVEIDLGTVQTTPTVGITDYSRRVTDDFGVTTVVERGFARRMSVRLALPFDDVDRVQQSLAALRATPVQWIADDRFDWLDFPGFYKDFELDLALPPLSFCTLTVEGLAETSPGADTGEDAAPEGSASTFSLLDPVTVTPAMLTSTNIAEAEWPQWSNVATYAMGDRVLKTSTHRVYESAIAGNTGNDPENLTSQWIDVGPTRRWAMFDQALGTLSYRFDTIEVTLAPGAVDALALIDVVGATVRVQTTGYDETQDVAPGTIAFLDLPGVAAPITVTITGTGTVSVGTLLVGHLSTLGVTGDSPTAGIIDFSRKEIDDFGEVTIVERAWSKRMSAKTLIRTDALDLVANRIAAVRARPSLWIADRGTDALTIYGFFKDFSIEVGENVSFLSLSVEGLSEAPPAGGGGLTVNWPDVVDSNPAQPKPEDGATVGAPVGTPVGDRPAETINAQIDAAMAQIDDLFETYGDTASASLAAAAAAEARDAAIDAAGEAGGYAATTLTLRDEAQDFASAAHAEALNADDRATAAAASAVAASGHESSAASSSALSANFSAAARLQAANLIPSTFADNGKHFFAGYSGAPSAVTPVGDTFSNGIFADVAGVGRVMQVNTGSSLDISNVGAMQIRAGRTYRATIRYRTLSSTRPVVLYLITLDASYTYIGLADMSVSPTATTTWQTTTITKTGDEMLAGGAAYIRCLARAGGGAPSLQWSVCGVEDVTESEKSTTQAGIATAQAAAATAQAANASTSQTLTANYRADTVRLNGNFGFELGMDNWYENIVTGAGGGTAPSMPIADNPRFSIQTGAATYWDKDLVLNPGNNRSIYSGTLIPVNTARKYRIRTQISAWGASPVGHAETYVGFVGCDAQGNYLDHGAYGTFRYSAATGLFVTSGNPLTPSAIVTGEGNDSWTKFPPGTKMVRLMAILNYNNNATLNTYLGGIWLEDVTETEAAASSASVSTAQAAIATAQASAAQVSALLSASYGKGYMNPNANFAAWPDPLLAPQINAMGWSVWDGGFFGGGNNRRLHINSLGYATNNQPEGSEWAYAPVVPTSGTHVGLQTSPGEMVAGPGLYTIDATSLLMDGTNVGSGILVYCFNGGGSVIQADYLRFWVDADLAGNTGSNYLLRRWSRNFTAPAGTVAIRVYAMANWAGFPSGATAAKVIAFLNVGLTKASATDATVLTQASVLATHDTKLASWMTSTSAGAAVARVKMNAADINGNPASSIGIEADYIALGTGAGPVLQTVAGRATVTGDLYVQNGRILVDTGTHMKVIGNGFGSSSQFIEWYGPKMALNLCTEANGNAWLKKDGSGYFGGSLSAGVLKNAAQTSSISPFAEVTTGSFGSNGGPRVVALSYSYSDDQTILGSCPVTPAMTATIELYRGTSAAGTYLASLNHSGGDWSCSPGFGEFEPGGWHVTAGGSITYTDNSGGATASYFARMTARNMPNGSNTKQRVGIVCTEA